MKRRIYVQGVDAESYALEEQRLSRVRSPHVIEEGSGELKGYNEGAGDVWLMGPDNEPFLTQSLQVHLVQIEPGGRNEAHGHQNEALFYILEGSGYELHDGVRYDWGPGDVVAVHNDSVHWHHNPGDQRSKAVVIKAKSLWLFLGLIQQGKVGYRPKFEELYGPRQEWSVAHPAESERLKKVLRPGDTRWEWTPHGKVRLLSGPSVDFRNHSVDAHLLEIQPDGRSGKQWQMGDLLIYVLEGHGYDLHWDVEVELDDRYYARVAKEPSRWEWAPGDLIWVPHNSQHQHFNTGPGGRALLLVAQARAYRHLGYTRVEQLEPAPEYETP